MSGYDDFEDHRVKHLEFIQAVVGRLGNDAFLVKGWALTVAAAFIGFGVSSHNWGLALASVVPTITFWGLDAYFLRCERLFRRLYAKVRRKDTDVEPFFMDATSERFIDSLSEDDDVGSWGKTLKRRTLSPVRPRADGMSRP